MMEEPKLPEIKSWRTKFGVSQKKLADFAKISLATLRQIEIGAKHKPHNKTLQKLASAIEDIQGKTTKAKIGEPAAVQEVKAKIPKVTAVEKPKRRGRKPKKVVDKVKKKRGRKAKLKVAKAAPVKTPVAASARKTTVKKPPVLITNLDLELINRILRMNGKEKLELLQKLL